jgi:hypothetical protein
MSNSLSMLLGSEPSVQYQVPGMRMASVTAMTMTTQMMPFSDFTVSPARACRLG